MANQSYHLDFIDSFTVYDTGLTIEMKNEDGSWPSQTGRYEISYFILINKILHIFSSDRQSRVNKNRDIEIYEDQVNQLKLETKARLQKTVDDLKADLSKLTQDHQQDTEPLIWQLREAERMQAQLQIVLRSKETEHESKRKFVEKKIEAAQKDLDGFGQTPDRSFPTLDKEFECPVCFQAMGPPRQIFQCPSGHLICDLCKTRGDFRSCHVCRVPIRGGFTRSLAVERVVRAYLGENSK